MLISSSSAILEPAKIPDSSVIDRTLPPPREGETPPVILLGGEANALSVARDLGRQGIVVYAMGEEDSCAKRSRYIRWISPSQSEDAESSWAAFLRGPQAVPLRGAVLLACSDAGLQVLIRHRDELLNKYRLDLMDTVAQAAMLDKLSTYKLAREAGTPVPGFWEVSQREEVLAAKDQFTYPLLIKPRLSHVFEAKFGRKHVTAHSFEELMTAFNTAHEAGVDMLIMELVPGEDDRLCSYFTYLDEVGQPLFHFTKRVIRRYPSGMGAACYHVTDHVPEIIEPSLKLFRHAGLRGVANVEYKLDRDGTPRLIECNARFVASNALVSDSGLSIARFVYNRILHRPTPPMDNYRLGMRMWDPVRDFAACRELRQAGRITYGQWLKSILHRQTWPYFRWSDPMPTLYRFSKPLRKLRRR